MVVNKVNMYLITEIELLVALLAEFQEGGVVCRVVRFGKSTVGQLERRQGQVANVVLVRLLELSKISRDYLRVLQRVPHTFLCVIGSENYSQLVVGEQHVRAEYNFQSSIRAYQLKFFTAKRVRMLEKVERM